MRDLSRAVCHFVPALVVTLVLVFQGPAVSAASDLGGPFSLTDHNGASVTDEDYVGAPALLYFGFASCGHICPTDLARNAAIVNALETSDGIKIRPIFVTIDPARDTPERLADYVSQFHPEYVGLTGSDEAIADIADKYAVYYKPVPMGETYMMDHSTFSFLVGPDGNYLAHFGREAATEEVLAQIRSKLARN